MRYAKNMYTGKGKKGSALIMVMLVIAGITTIIFATQRIALVQFSQSVREEDNLTAYYAAQAGIEDGLVRYRFERNTEIHEDSNNNRVKFRFDLTNATFPRNPYEISSDIEITEGVNGNYDPKHQYYDLAMNYRTYRINISGTGSILDHTNSVIKKDEVLTLTGFPPSGSFTNYLRYVIWFIDEPAGCPLDQAFITFQIIRTTETGGNIQRDSEQIVVKNIFHATTNRINSSNTSNLDVSSSGTSTVSSIRIRAFHCDIEYALASSKTATGNGSVADQGLEFDSLITEIISTGYFGSAKRTLIAQVDRQTGNLIGIFDYILYAGSTDIDAGTIGR